MKTVRRLKNRVFEQSTGSDSPIAVNSGIGSESVELAHMVFSGDAKSEDISYMLTKSAEEEVMSENGIKERK